MEQEEYLLALQGGWETEFLVVYHVLLDPWKGEVEFLLMVFLSGLQRQKIVLASSKPARRVLSATPLLAATRAGFSQLVGQAIPKRESKHGRAFPELARSDL